MECESVESLLVLCQHAAAREGTHLVQHVHDVPREVLVGVVKHLGAGLLLKLEPALKQRDINTEVLWEKHFEARFKNSTIGSEGLFETNKSSVPVQYINRHYRDVLGTLLEDGKGGHWEEGMNIEKKMNVCLCCPTEQGTPDLSENNSYTLKKDLIKNLLCYRQYCDRYALRGSEILKLLEDTIWLRFFCEIRAVRLLHSKDVHFEAILRFLQYLRRYGRLEEVSLDGFFFTAEHHEKLIKLCLSPVSTAQWNLQFSVSQECEFIDLTGGYDGDSSDAEDCQGHTGVGQGHTGDCQGQGQTGHSHGQSQGQTKESHGQAGHSQDKTRHSQGEAATGYCDDLYDTALEPISIQKTVKKCKSYTSISSTELLSILQELNSPELKEHSFNVITRIGLQRSDGLMNTLLSAWTISPTSPVDNHLQVDNLTALSINSLRSIDNFKTNNHCLLYEGMKQLFGSPKFQELQFDSSRSSCILLSLLNTNRETPLAYLKYVNSRSRREVVHHGDYKMVTTCCGYQQSNICSSCDQHLLDFDRDWTSCKYMKKLSVTADDPSDHIEPHLALYEKLLQYDQALTDVKFPVEFNDVTDCRRIWSALGNRDAAICAGLTCVNIDSMEGDSSDIPICSMTSLQSLTIRRAVLGTITTTSWCSTVTHSSRKQIMLAAVYILISYLIEQDSLPFTNILLN